MESLGSGGKIGLVKSVEIRNFLLLIEYITLQYVSFNVLKAQG